MARETKAERLVRYAQELETRRAEEAASYPTRMLDTLQLATSMNYELKVVDAKFVAREWNSRKSYSLTPLYTEDSESELQELRWELEDLQAEREMERQRYEMKQAALAKLTPTEKELLGLK